VSRDAASVVTRRQALSSLLFGAGWLGLRALATGLPASVLLDPRRALAQGAPGSGCVSKAGPQFVIFSTSGAGDPINASVPGTYEDPAIVHSSDPSMAPAPLTLAGNAFTAATPWSTLPQAVLDRTCFWHLMTDTPVHPKQPDVLRLMGAAQGGEMLPSLLARALAPCLGTIQAQPISIGAVTPSEAISYGGQTQPIIPPLALRATLTSPAGPLTNLQALRDRTLSRLYGVYGSSATPAGRAYIDSLVTSQAQARSIEQSLLSSLSSIKDNSPASQVTAAIVLVQMKVSPVVVIHVPFGGDNHRDVGLQAETTQTVAGVATIASLLSQLQAAGLGDRVSFVSLNVFGRTLGPGNTDGRQHNENHQVSLSIGSPFRGGVMGGVAPVAGDYGALPIDSKTGKGVPGGDVPALATLPSFAVTMLTGLTGLAPSATTPLVSGGQVISASLA
jgi:hypothetical protein